MAFALPADGTLIAAVTVGGNGDDVLLALEAAPNNHIIVAGWFQSDTMTEGNRTVFNRGSLDPFVAYMDAPGE